MRLSLAFEMQRPVLDDHAVIEDTLQQCVLADEMGFDAVWFVEHHFLTSFSMSPCPEVMFGALSRLTKRIRLGFGVVILPYHHPVRVAERELQFLMATETVPHDKVMSSIEMFGKYVIPRLKRRSA